MSPFDQTSALPVDADTQPETPTLRDVIVHLEVRPDLPRRRQRDMLSAVRTICRILGAAPGDLYAEPGALRRRLDAVSPAMAQMTASRWASVRSLTLAALREFGIDVLPGRRTRRPLAPAWDNLRLTLPDKYQRHGLSRFMSYCTSEGIGPADVTPLTFESFQHAVKNKSLVRHVDWVYRNTCVTWNKASDSIPGWPKCRAEVPSASRRYSLPWTDFPESFQADAEAFVAHTANQDPFADDYAPSISKATAINRRKQLLQLATALVRSGYSTENLTTLAVLTDPDNAKAALRFFVERAGGKSTENVYNYALLLRTISRHWVRPRTGDRVAVEEHQSKQEKLDKLCRQLAVRRHGMTEKNRTRLRQFDDRRSLDAFLHLPSRLFARVKRGTLGGRRDARLAMYGLAIELLTVAPIRIKNLTMLEVDRHLVRTRVGPTANVHLAIPAEEMKNGEPYEAKLPEGAAELLTTYLKEYRPQLLSAPSPWLFPHASGKSRNRISFGRRIGEVIYRETGVRMHVHLFRHLAVKLQLEAHPEDLETARRILGHKSLQTTLRSYADLQAASAFRRYDAVIQTLRHEGQPRSRDAKRASGVRAGL